MIFIAIICVAPSRERELKLTGTGATHKQFVAPSRERELKPEKVSLIFLARCRSLTGA